MHKKIYYKQVRDLGGIFSATFGFIKHNFKTLYGSLLFFAGPLLLIAATVSSVMIGTSLNFGMLRGNGVGLGSIYGDIIIAYLTTMFILMIGITIYNVILNRNIIENEKLGTEEPLTIKHSTLYFWSDFWRVLGNMLLLGIVMFVTLAIVVLLFAGIFALLGGGKSGGGMVVIALGVILVIISMIIFGPILSFLPMASLFVCQRDEINIFAALKKVLFYMKGNFWITWVITMVGLLMYMVLGSIVQIPVFIVSLITTFSRANSTVGYGMADQSTPILLTVVTAICTLLSYGVMVIYYLTTIYQFTSLEEKKEGVSIIDKINQIQ
ncbi:MAG: hypothetical protein IPM51_16005 [Sphingobacteriaceae bacterium]|nr:hypothetical protein [Sphingobacteriaceae bacterium]